jgi:hypothetical protein
LDVLVERVDEHPERQVPLELRRGTPQHEVPAVIGATGELSEQAGLADTGLTHHLDRSPSPPIEVGKGTVEGIELLSTPDETLSKQGHLHSHDQ